MFFTVGHGTRTRAELLGILKANRISTLVDVRSYPMSGTNPQFNQVGLSRYLQAAGIRYLWMGDTLGGRRHKSRESSKHRSIEQPGFRNYAGWMESETFREGIDQLIRMRGRICLMCSETLWWRCHRRMISDFLVYMGHPVEHLGVGQKNTQHTMWALARKARGKLVYDR